MPDRPNVLWYCSDQQRYDTIRELGNRHVNTPNLDRLAAEGVACEQAYCQSPIGDAQPLHHAETPGQSAAAAVTR
ncbi:MAG TPA: hypothetical protein VG370_07360 [Chloroflexota bacterium]|jgi:arylsulfatase A-like enzyme|nr:hypothetical protein [Chloroflexota bacterium]